MQPFRILMIDNAISHKKVMRAAMQEILEALPDGGSLALATDAEETRQLLATFQPHALTVNYALSILRVDDTPFVPWLVKTTHLPIIAYGLSDVLRGAALATGIDAYFLRPTYQKDWPPFCSKVARFLWRLAFPGAPPLHPAVPATNRAAGTRPPFRTPVPTAAADTPRPATTTAAAAPTAPSTPAEETHAATPSAPPPMRNSAPIPPTLRQHTASQDDQAFALLARTAHRYAQASPRPQTACGLPANLRPVPGIELIAIGASTGGTDAIADVLHALVPPLPPIVIVQHIPAYFSRLFAIRLNEECCFSVEEGENGRFLAPNHAYIAPGEYHMSVARADGKLFLRCLRGPKVHSVRPSVDVLFNSVVKTVGKNALGVLLTGMGKDGAAGLLRLHQLGAPTIGQDQATCVVYGMPRVAHEMGAVRFELPLPHIGPAIQRIVSQP